MRHFSFDQSEPLLLTIHKGRSVGMSTYNVVLSWLAQHHRTVSARAVKRPSCVLPMTESLWDPDHLLAVAAFQTAIQTPMLRDDESLSPYMAV